MRTFAIVLGSLAVSGLAVTAAQAAPEITSLTYAVMRDGAQIGTSTLRLQRDGVQMTADVAVHVEVKIAFVTVYRFDQSETEQWSNGKLLAVNAVTDDNGTLHKVSATRRGDRLVVDADGKRTEVDAAVIPASLWNAALVQKTMALDLKDGSLTPVSVVDHGKEQLVLQGRATIAHHYSIRTAFPQDVWYDQNHQLVKVEMRGSDGSRIHYQPG